MVEIPPPSPSALRSTPWSAPKNHRKTKAAKMSSRPVEEQDPVLAGRRRPGVWTRARAHPGAKVGGAAEQDYEQYAADAA